MKSIYSFGKIATLVCLAALILGIALYFFPIENQTDLKSKISRPKLANENFKHDARRIGGSAFPVPRINSKKISREPSINSSNFKTRRQGKHVPVFLMPRPFVQDITTIKSGRKTVKIAYIAPLPADSRCTIGGKTRPCGKIARTALRALIRGRTLTCKVPQSGSENDVLTTSCNIGNIDIAGWLVKHGWTRAANKN